ncbi:MAG: hypothetical protein ACK4M2_14030, partial [Brevundimonas sp.]
RKIPAAPPARPSAAPQEATGEGVTETLRHGLATTAPSDWSRRMLVLEGGVRLDVDLDDLRQDRTID